MSKSGSVVLALLWALGARHALAAPTVVTLSFDDTLADQAQVGPLLAARGLHATFFVNNPRFDQPGYLTSAEVSALALAGNEIGGHTLQHFNLVGMPADEQRRQICDDRVGLLARGFNVTSFAYPLGGDDVPLHTIVSDCGYNSARDIGGFAFTHSETMPPRMMMAIRTPPSVKVENTLAELQLFVTDAEVNGGGWVPFVFHHVCDGCNPLSVSPSLLTLFLDWLAARAAMGTTVQTIEQVIGGPLKPGVPGPIAPPYLAADGNLLRNPSLETDLDANQVPDCWLISSGGDPPQSYSSGAAPAAHSGSYAEQLTVTPGYTSSPRLLSLQDLGTCAPAITPGTRFQLSAFYQSTDSAVLIAYYRTSTGWWKYWAQSPVQPASATFIQATWTTPAAPADARAVSVGMSLVSTGTLAIDDVLLVDTAVVDMAAPVIIDMAAPIIVDMAVPPIAVDLAVPPIVDMAAPVIIDMATVDLGAPAAVDLAAPVTVDMAPPPDLRGGPLAPITHGCSFGGARVQWISTCGVVLVVLLLLLRRRD